MFFVIVIFSVLTVSLLLSRKYRNTMKGKLFLSIGLIVFTVSMMLFFVFSDYLTIDKCLDNGGRWDSSQQECEY